MREDAEFLELARTDKVVYITTLMVGEGYLQAGQETVDRRRYPLDCADSMSRARVAGGPVHLAEGKEWWADTNVVRMIESQRSMAVANAMPVQDSGVTIAAGTDAGNPGTLHGPSIYRELALLREAGLSPMEVLVAATRNAARWGVRMKSERSSRAERPISWHSPLIRWKMCRITNGCAGS